MLRSELHEALTYLGITTTEKELDEYLLIADADGKSALHFRLLFLLLYSFLIKT